MMRNYFIVQVVDDGEKTYTRTFTSALEAVRVYDSFIDHGMSRHRREVVLVESSNITHAKVFDRCDELLLR